MQTIAGARDPAVPPGNADYLHERLPNSKLDLIDAGHFAWEDAADEYAALVTSWWRRLREHGTCRTMSALGAQPARARGEIKFT